MKEKRDMGLDLLRVLCMLMVVCNHLISWSHLFMDEAEAMTPMWLVGNTFFGYMMPAVNCFVLISGYFLCTSTFRLKKLVSLWLQVVTYSAGIYLLVCLFHGETDFSVMQFLKNCLVVTMGRYWFVTAYVLMYIVSPFLNRAIHAMDKKRMRYVVWYYWAFSQ